LFYAPYVLREKNAFYQLLENENTSAINM